MNKSLLRQEMKTHLDSLEWNKVNETLQRHLDSFLHTHQEDLFPLGAFWPMEKLEPDIRPSLFASLEQNQSILLPKCQEKDMFFLEMNPDVPLMQSSLGFHEPQSGTIKEPKALLIPLLAFDPQGFRLGKGLGFYDRFINNLRQKNPKTLCIGIASHTQKVRTVYPESHDQPLTAVITDSGVQEF